MGPGGSPWSLGGSLGVLEAQPVAVKAYFDNVEAHTKVL